MRGVAVAAVHGVGSPSWGSLLGWQGHWRDPSGSAVGAVDDDGRSMFTCDHDEQAAWAGFGPLSPSTSCLDDFRRGLVLVEDVRETVGLGGGLGDTAFTVGLGLVDGLSGLSLGLWYYPLLEGEPELMRVSRSSRARSTSSKAAWTASGALTSCSWTAVIVRPVWCWSRILWVIAMVSSSMDSRWVISTSSMVLLPAARRKAVERASFSVRPSGASSGCDWWVRCLDCSSMYWNDTRGRRLRTGTCVGR